MLKTISAAVLAVSMIAAPALAADAGKTTQTPAAGKTAQVPAANAPAKASALNANAKMRKHHRRYHHTSAVKGHSKVSLKHAAVATKRG